MLEHPEIGWIEQTGYPSWAQERDVLEEDGVEADNGEQMDWEAQG